MKKRGELTENVTETVRRGATAKQYIVLILFLFIAGTLPVHSQCAMSNARLSAGERIDYNLHFNWKFIWTKAGTASLTFDKATYQSQPAYKIELIAGGNKTADTFFKLRDTLTSYVSERIEPLYYKKGAVEGKRHWVDEIFFSYENGVSNVKQRRHEKGEILRNDTTDSRCIYDLLSVLAWARFMDVDNLSEGQRIDIPVATGKRIDEQKLIYLGKSQFTADNKQTYNCLFFSLVKTEKDKEKAVMNFNVTDDRNRIPVGLDLFLNFGSAKASVTQVTGNAYPFTSIVTP